MQLGDYLDVDELRRLIASRHILRRNHPTLPIAILNYSNACTFDNFWPDTVQKCRGLIINPKANHEVCGECQIVSRPFHKFFNLNDTSHEEAQEHNLPKVDPTVTEKMDGWFGIMWKCGTPEGKYEYGIASRGSFDSIGANFATQKLQKLVKYGAVEEFPEGYTPIFEIIHKDCKIVVDYPFEGLVLLGCVNNETGEDLPYVQLQSIWAKIAGYAADNRPWIRLVKAHKMSLDACKTYESSVKDLIWKAKRGQISVEDVVAPVPVDSTEQRNHDGTVKNKEGFVLSYQRPGTWPIRVKVKFEEYKSLHKIITGVTPQMIWETLHDPMASWLNNQVPDHFKKWALKWRDELYEKFHMELEMCMSALDEKVVMDAWLKPGGAENESKGSSAWRKGVFTALTIADPARATIAMSLGEGRIYDAYQSIWSKIRPIGRISETFYREGQGE